MNEPTRRSSLDITMDILNTLSLSDGPMSKFRIMCKANTSWKMLEGILSQLAEKGLVESFDNGKLFTETAAGRQLASTWREIKESLDVV